MDLAEFSSHFHHIRQRGDQMVARCPAHEDSTPSLSIGMSSDGRKILVHCFAGCDMLSILEAVGLDKSDLKVW